MYVEIELESNPREPIAGDEPPFPGVDIAVRSHRETTVYRNCWCIEVGSLEELRRLVEDTSIEVHPPVHAGTDALVRVLDRPQADATTETHRRVSYS